MARRKGLKTSHSSTLPKNGVKEIDFTEAVDIFLTGMLLKGLAPRTREWHKENLSALKNFLTQEGKNTAPVSMTESILKQNFILPMIKHGFKINTINGRIRTCRSFYTYLLKEGYILSNPAKRLTKLKQDKPIIETFTKNQVNKLLSVINRQTFVGFRDYVIILLFLETGIRVSEAARIKVEHILFEEQMIRIHGKGAKGRIVPFQTKLKGLMYKYLKERSEVDHPYLFINRDEKPLKKRTIQDRFSIYGKKANLKGVRCSPHTMRHTMAKFYIMAGGDVFSLQKILGHASLDMVRRYVELFGSEIKEQHKKYSPIKDFT